MQKIFWKMWEGTPEYWASLPANDNKWWLGKNLSADLTSATAADINKLKEVNNLCLNSAKKYLTARRVKCSLLEQ